MIPVKRLALAKSRLADPSRNRALALAFALDTVSAAIGAAGVARVLVVTGETEVARAADLLGALVRPDVHVGGLNAALRSGAGHAMQAWGPHPIASLPSDLPALRSDELAGALTVAAGHLSSYVADAAGSGTTLLTARTGRLEPQYGEGSAAAHGAAAHALSGDWPGLRHDVDIPADLLVAAGLGVGPHTSALLGADGRARAG